MTAMHASQSDQQLYQLQQLDPAAWSQLLRFNTGDQSLNVVTVQTEEGGNNQTRYLLELDGVSDPITLLGRRTTQREAHFYADLAEDAALVTSRCWFAHAGSRDGWIILSEPPHDMAPAAWDSADILQIVTDLAHFHTTYWGQRQALLRNTWLPYMLGTRRRKSARALQHLPKDWNRDIISEHALRTVEGLAPRWLDAAKGLRMLLDLNGWQNVIEEKHLRAMADLLDDPLPMLHPLRELPQTLVHGYAGIYNWRTSVFDKRTLVDWQQVAIGPGISDLVTFIETFGLLQDGKMNWRVRDKWPVAEETMIDTYILTLSAELGGGADAQAVRHAIPAARCLHIMLTWLPRFHQWFDSLPMDIHARRDMWDSINSYDQEDLSTTVYAPIAGLRPYLADVFHRFLRSYYQITG